MRPAIATELLLGHKMCVGNNVLQGNVCYDGETAF
jgi:hypothetical protein